VQLPCHTALAPIQIKRSVRLGWLELLGSLPPVQSWAEPHDELPTCVDALPVRFHQRVSTKLFLLTLWCSIALICLLISIPTVNNTRIRISVLDPAEILIGLARYR
jgi:hypothetical protein